MKIRRFSRGLRLALLFVALAIAGYTLYLDFRVRHEFEGRRFAVPARVYARPLEFYAGLRLAPDAFEEQLRLLGYRPGMTMESVGRYERRGDTFELVTRPFTFWDGKQEAMRLRVAFSGGYVRAVTRDGQDVPLARLDARQIGGIYPAHNEDRVLVRLADVPQDLVQAVIAVEDRRFYSHPGVDLRGTARALVHTATGQGVQGGSTVTQQLVKNFFLTPERTLRRKFTEAIMALLLEMHFEKDEILETYLNEIYLGQDRNRAIHGMGLAAQFYFGKPVENVSLPEAALLVALIKGPSYYDPRRHPQRARARRDLVLATMRDQNLLPPAQYLAARAAPLGVTEAPAIGASAHPAFLDLVRRQLARDFAADDLRSEGLRIFTTLDPLAQEAAERALARQLARLEVRQNDRARLEGATIVTDSQSGEVLALVGGRDPLYEGFNRALDAARPVGSMLKPAIFLTALGQPSRYTLATLLDDSPLVWKSRGAPDWRPANYDGRNHGLVPLRLALAHSYNIASARLGLELGVPRVLDTVQRLGATREIAPHAASLLGATALSPFEIAQMYQTLAANGFRLPLRAIREVASSEGEPVSRYGVSVEAAFEPESVYLLTDALQEVVRDGTGQGLRQWFPEDLAIAGKTGTTDDLRDSWFAGFTGDRLAVVWVGYDDNRTTGLTGASGAMTVWAETMRALDPEPLVVPIPENVERAWIDPETGLRADSGCAGAVELPFIKGSAPETDAPCVTSVGTRVRSWFRQLFE